MLIKKEKKGSITVYYVEKDMTDEKALFLKNKKVQAKNIHLIIKENADVYDNTSGELLAKFRKGVLNPKKVETFYNNVISFAERPTSNRGSTSGSKSKNVGDNPQIMSNIFGYFDAFSPSQKLIFKKRGIKTPLPIRETRFNMDYPEKYEKCVPLIQEIDEQYAKLIPKKYALQKKKAGQTPFRIANTCFTTITTNVNFQTTIHKDVGDDPEGFGNLTVIEYGKYTGGETCFPQYGIGFDVRNYDVLFMNVHEWHGNLPIKKESADARRLSIVCYLRLKVWEKTKGKTRKFMIQHNKTLKNMRVRTREPNQGT
jgi:hypothetical protein